MAWEALMWRETCSVRIAVVTGKVRPVIAVGTLSPPLTVAQAGILVQALTQGLAGTRFSVATDGVGLN